MGYSWIIKKPQPFSYKSITPIKMRDMDILELTGNFQMFRTRRDAVEELRDEMNDMTFREAMNDLRKTPSLKWSDEHCTLWKYIQSKFAIVMAPSFFFVVIPIFKIGIEYQIKKSYKLNPEWWI